MLPYFLILSLLISSSVALLGFIGNQQSIAVSGRLICNGKPASGVKVKLYDKGTISDNKLDQSNTNNNGEFVLAGKRREVTRIDPKVNIYHKCNYKGGSGRDEFDNCSIILFRETPLLWTQMLNRLCYKKLTISIPKDHITKGAKPQRTYDIGTLNLANRVKGESTDCIN